MNDGKLQVEAKLKVDVSEASLLQNKLRELAQEQDRIASKAAKTQGGSSSTPLLNQGKVTSIMRGFSQGGIEGGLLAVSKVAPKLQGALVPVLGSLFLIQQAFQIGWNVGLKIIDKTIGKLERMADAAAQAARQIYDGIAASQKLSFEKAEKRIKTASERVDEDSGYRQSALSRSEREDAAARRLSRAKGNDEQAPSTGDVDQAAERLNAQRKKLEVLQKEYDEQKGISERDLQTARERFSSGADNAGEMGRIARLQSERVATLQETLEAEKRKQADLEAELESARKIAGIDLQTHNVEIEKARSAAAEKASEAKRSYEDSRKTPETLLNDKLRDLDNIKAKFEDLPQGPERSKAEAVYWSRLEEAMSLQDSIRKQLSGPAISPSSDAYARIGGYLGGAGGSGIDYNRRTATATEKSATLLKTIAGKLQPAQQPVATWG